MLLVFSGVWTFLVDAYPAYAASALAANTFTRCKSYCTPDVLFYFILNQLGMFAGAFPLFGNQSKSPKFNQQRIKY